MSPTVTSIPPLVAETWYRRFAAVMPHRIREILLVSSSYDAFVLDEDGPLTERLFSGYSELHLSQAPRITHVSSIAEALARGSSRRFDLVMTVSHLPDGDVTELTERFGQAHPDVPVVLFVFDEDELDVFPDRVPPAGLHSHFLWSGDARVLIAAIKTVEDRSNVDHDTQRADVPVIIVVEDDTRAWSSFLGLLYTEMLSQANSLIEEGLNDQHRLMRMRARPRILLAHDYESASALAKKYADHLFALITDVTYPQNGKRRLDAGIALSEELRKRHPNLPVLLQSSDPDLAELSEGLGAWYAKKREPGFPALVRRFLRDALGFGDFLFRLADGTVVDRARNVPELEEALHAVPAESLEHHASRNDFSVWLRARAMFDIADELRPRGLSEFASIEAVRRFLIETLSAARGEEQEGVITDVWAPPSARQNRFVRVGTGSMGGKGRAIAYVNSLIVQHGLLKRFGGLEVRVPRTIVVGTDVYERYVEENVESTLREGGEAEAMRAQVLGGHFPEDIESLLRQAFRNLRGPIAVRSSTLSEDSRVRSFAGVYETYMLPNTASDPEERFQLLLDAIKRVYSSVYGSRARSYVAGTPHSLDDEKMAVVIQQVVGQRHGERFYPHAAGVAQSYNYYPVAPQTTDGGVVSMVLGLGALAVGGGGSLRFSPAVPESLPQYSSARDYLRGSQRELKALDLETGTVESHGLEAAEEDGTLALAGSRYIASDGVLRDDLLGPGTRVVTWRNVLKHDVVPLSRALRELLLLLRQGMASEVEMEFALDMADWGKRVKRGQKKRDPRLYILQVRPMPAPELTTQVADVTSFSEEQTLMRTSRALGHGSLESIRDIVYVQRQDLNGRETVVAAREVRAINETLRKAGRGYLLVGPGRWGTSDSSLGLPVDWTDIAAARVIVEIPLESGFVEPSQGTHFFHNLTASRIGYLTVTPEHDGWFDRAWLDARASTDRLVSHVELEQPITVHMDGHTGAAVVLKPGE